MFFFCSSDSRDLSCFYVFVFVFFLSMSLLSELCQLCLSSPVLWGCSVSFVLCCSIWILFVAVSPQCGTLSWKRTLVGLSFHGVQMLSPLLNIPGNPWIHLPVLSAVFKLALWVFQLVVVQHHILQMFFCFPQSYSIHLLIACISPSYSWIVPPGYFRVQQDIPSPGFNVKVYVLLWLLFYYPLFCSWRNSGIFKN